MKHPHTKTYYKIVKDNRIEIVTDLPLWKSLVYKLIAEESEATEYSIMNCALDGRH